MHPGEQLRQIRDKLGLSTREVESRSRQIAQNEGNPEFAISNPWLSQIENSDAALSSIYKLFSLSAIYGVSYSHLLLLYGVDTQKAAMYHGQMPLHGTHLARFEPPDDSRTITLPVRFDGIMNLHETSLLSRMIEVWGAVPVGLIQHLDLRHSQYGYIGLRDYFMYPLLRPGSFVQIDSKVRRPQKGVFQSEFDRPIYFIELRDGYACSWCQLAGSNLLLIPHSLSSCDVRLFSYGIEAEIVGQVTGVAMRIVDSGSQSPSTAPDPKTKLGLRDAIDGDPSG